ncbi:MAG TPA: CinA family protein [Thermodesulfobacteriota bacterium]|nr:CinA family protein [Thermodesulfobacteriota bacterium]
MSKRKGTVPGIKKSGLYDVSVCPHTETPELRGSSGITEIARKLIKKRLTLGVAESCTGGLVSSTLTDVPGSSKWFKGAVVAYTNAVKTRILGVRAKTLKKYGAISKETALELAKGVRKKLKTDIGVSITGLAGPGGGTKKTPVGTIFIGAYDGKKTLVKRLELAGSRITIKNKAAEAALRALKELLR